MKTYDIYLSVLVLLLGTLPSLAQSSGENCITIQKNTSSTNYVAEHNYYDGLGRFVENVSVNLSPESGVDLLEATSYDGFGRVRRKGKMVSLSGNSGNYTEIEQKHYIADYNDPMAYVEYSYEDSPLGRLRDERGPGAPWIMQGKSRIVAYLTNSTNAHMGCLRFEVSNDILCNKSYYPDGSLNIIQKIDEGARVTYEFKDLFDRLVLIRKVMGDTEVDT